MWKLLLVLLLLPGQALAGPPERVSGRMAIDEVADGLRRYSREKDENKRTAWLERLAPTRDIRVAVALGDVTEMKFTGEPPPIFWAAVPLLTEHYILSTPDEKRWRSGHCVDCQGWWEAHKADLRRRVKELPR